MSSTVLQVRLVKKEQEAIDRMVRSGFFASKSDFIRASIRHYLGELSRRELLRRASAVPPTGEELDRLQREAKGVRRVVWRGRSRHGT